jgi:aldehyde:ferredoxin oxidoreductase
MGKVINGYMGKQLRINLTKKEIKVESLDLNILRKYIGGVGYGAKLLYDELNAKIDPLSADNKLVFATSPLTVNNIPGGGSIMICFKSPATNGWGESRCGGDFGPDLRKAGYDFLIIEGKSEEPIYILIEEDNVELKPAKHLKGKMVSDKIKIIQDETSNPKLSVMVIGPAGENLVKYSSIMFGHRAAGRTGAGAVMGSKNLLGIAVKGIKKSELANADTAKKMISEALKVIKKSPTASHFREHGTTCEIENCDAVGDWPTKNWQSNSWGKGQRLYSYFYKNNLDRYNGCYRGCPVACGRIISVKEGKFKTPQHQGAEYESITAFTAFILNDDMDAAVHATYLCNEYGLDTISTGAVIAFSMECYEKNIISKEDTGGLELNWGNSSILPELIKKIAFREGIGDLLAKGVKETANILGKGSSEFAIHGKGLEAPAHDPRSGKMLALSYGTANRGMCHIHPMEGMAYDCFKMDFGLIKYGVPDPNKIDRWGEKGKGKIFKILQDALILPDILDTCKLVMYSGLTLDHYANILSALTGWDIDGKELLLIGERVINLQRLFNIREGFGTKDDLIPKRMMQKPLFGEYKDQEECVISDYEGMLKEYYVARNWDTETGKPKIEKIIELQIEID